VEGGLVEEGGEEWRVEKSGRNEWKTIDRSKKRLATTFFSF
jgi:hypothetical protein